MGARHWYIGRYKKSRKIKMKLSIHGCHDFRKTEEQWEKRDKPPNSIQKLLGLTGRVED